AEDDFRLGDLFVDIINYTKEFRRGQINPMHIDIESGWNDPISEVYATGKVAGYPGVEFQTASVVLKPWAKGRLVGHFDTTTINDEAEEFEMELVLHYGDRTSEERVVLGFVEEEVNYLLWGGIIVGVLLVMGGVGGFVVWMVVKLKKLERRSGKKRR
ncbi:MAG: hypothetical protein ABIG28_01520, partial [archaeon]